MSGPQDIQNVAKMFGMPGMGRPMGPMPARPLGQTQKRMGDQRVPMSADRPQRNPGQIQDAAARKLGVQPYQVQPQQGPQASSTPRPQAPPVQAPKAPVAPERPVIPQQAPPPPTLPQPLEREPNPSQVSGIPMPRARPEGLEIGNMLAQLAGSDAGANPQAAAVAKVIQDRVGGMSSAQAAGAPPRPDPFSSGAAPIQAGPEMLMKVLAAAKMKADTERPPMPPQQPPNPNVTPPVPPDVPIPPPPAMREGNYAPSQPSFQGYEVRPSKAAKGEEKHREQVLKKGNSPYYYTRIGVRPGDNRGVAERLREVRAKAENPRTARKMTEEEDRILAQYNEDDAYLLSMLPADVAKRMQQYRSGNLVNQIPDRYSERPPGVTEESGAPTPLKLPPKARQKDPAAKQVEDVIDNPPKRNDTDPDENLPPEKPKYILREE
jgi:hypothetical protein